MEIYMKNLNFYSDKTQIIQHLASHLHGPDFLDPLDSPFNFHVQLGKNKRMGLWKHGGYGFLTLPDVELSNRFLQLYGGTGSLKTIQLGGKEVWFGPSKQTKPRTDVLQTIRLIPYRDPAVIEEEERRAHQLSAEQIPIETVQFGWECRDGAISIEAEDSPTDCIICFDEERRQFRIKFSGSDGKKYIIAIRISSIESMSGHRYLDQQTVVVFSLYDPPAYELEPGHSLEDLFSRLLDDKTPLRRSLSYLPTIPNHERVAPFASLVVRLVFKDGRSGLDRLQHLGKIANARALRVGDEWPIVRRGLFSEEAMEEYENWTRKLPWSVAYQVEAIVRSRAADVKEMLDILPDIDKLAREGKETTAAMLRTFRTKVTAMFHSDEADDKSNQSVRDCFRITQDEYSKTAHDLPLMPTDGSLCQSLHVVVTPTAVFLEGPFPERSNRVIRAYDSNHHESFLRVTFTDEGRLQYRSSDREIDHGAFIRERFGSLLLRGLVIAKRQFKFLAYSQSALKEHSVWFVKPFTDPKHGLVTTQSIIASLGTFDGLVSDPKLMNCPARYAARLSQSFTATDACTIDVEEIHHGHDIEVVDEASGLKYCFTDGVGTLSSELAQNIWFQLKQTKRRARALRGYPAAYQVRFMGSKGMLSVDPRLQGNIICLRPSMIKFEAPNSQAIEIARSFDRPTQYFLNRPLIMLMEGLGVPYSTFKHFQDKAEHETKLAARSLHSAATMLETHGLGSGFRVPSLLLSLNKLGISALQEDAFYTKSIEFAINHILRQLKNHARIPIPGAWTLVGVADIHGILEPDQIFAYVKPINDKGIYLEGPILISRSPTIHPGDIQVVHAIGRPPQGSLLEKEPLANTVVFSVRALCDQLLVQGKRPLPSCLGGGDLDGDIYNLIPLSDPKLSGFQPSQGTFPPSNYAPAQRKVLNRKSTMDDVAEFVMEYILSDVLGMVAINWLIIADQSEQGIQDPDCIKLANLHSDAVDYPKSGNPVARTTIPKLKHNLKPDWNAPETVQNLDPSKYYKSKHAIGKLFRSITLPVEQNSMLGATRVQSRRRRQRAREQKQDADISSLGLDPHYRRIEQRVQEFIATEEPFSDRLFEDGENLYDRYVGELEQISYNHAIAPGRNSSLTEEEIFMGTIGQQTSQPRKRKDMMSKLREATDSLVKGIREILEGGRHDTEEDYLTRSWFAWLVSLDKGSEFGAQSFAWLTLGAVFEAIKQIEEREDKDRLGLFAARTR
ncbi:RNA-directed RNA polymerase 2 [Coprinopsis marcescibilis]|uniref:RNA-dependent RNA polymerase n=1 Tax=Coprinopsis marcescibilis TaxID=230819 RepID=A0A5C3LPF1_COPMA|nr:RNA-directed RNA polymerase 2 [Coprinopsis marcescibilis]